MRYLGGHLGPAVSALVDGQLDGGAAERAWTHALSCSTCRARVEHEGWVKTRLASMADGGTPADPPAGLIRSLHSLEAAGPDAVDEAWAAVHELERRGRGRRRAGLALAGAGSMSAAVLGLAALGGVPGGAGGGAPAATLTGRPTTVVSSPAPPAPVSTLTPRSAPAAPRRPAAAPRRDGTVAPVSRRDGPVGPTPSPRTGRPHRD